MYKQGVLESHVYTFVFHDSWIFVNILFYQKGTQNTYNVILNFVIVYCINYLYVKNVLLAMLFLVYISQESSQKVISLLLILTYDLGYVINISHLHRKRCLCILYTQMTSASDINNEVIL